jgi:hypothetical protein
MKTGTESIVGRSPEQLTIAERLACAGQWMALEIYTPTGLKEEGGKPEIDLKLRRIRALGGSAADCLRQLEQAGLDPRDFEFTQLTRPY